MDKSVLVWQDGERPDDPAKSADCPKCGGKRSVLILHRIHVTETSLFDTTVECTACGEHFERSAGAQ